MSSQHSVGVCLNQQSSVKSSRKRSILQPVGLQHLSTGIELFEAAVKCLRNVKSYKLQSKTATCSRSLKHILIPISSSQACWHRSLFGFFSSSCPILSLWLMELTRLCTKVSILEWTTNFSSLKEISTSSSSFSKLLILTPSSASRDKILMSEVGCKSSLFSTRIHLCPLIWYTPKYHT